MKFKSAFQYQISGTGKALLIFYSIIIAVNIFFLILSRIADGTSEFNGFEIASMIFIFVSGIDLFKESFHFFIQNGRSRKTLAMSSLAVIAFTAAFMTLADRLVVQNLSNFNHTLFSQAFTENMVVMNSLPVELLSVFFTYALIGFIGLFLGAIYYRMNLPEKLIVSIGVPVFFVVILPIIDFRYTDGIIFSAIGRFLLLAIMGISDISFISSMPLVLLIRLAIVLLVGCIYYVSTLRARVKA